MKNSDELVDMILSEIHQGVTKQYSSKAEREHLLNKVMNEIHLEADKPKDSRKCKFIPAYVEVPIDSEDVFYVIKRVELPSAQPEIVRCCKCGFWDRDTLRHQFNDFREWNEAECKILAERDPYHEINRYTEADDFCSFAERRTE